MSETNKERPGPLAGLRILDLTEERGLYAGKVLADLGADVVLLEKPEGSRARSIGPFKGDNPGIENSLYFLNFNTNKRGITLNLDAERGRDVFLRLVTSSDVVVEDFPIGRMHSLGLDYSVLHEELQGHSGLSYRFRLLGPLRQIQGTGHRQYGNGRADLRKWSARCSAGDSSL